MLFGYIIIFTIIQILITNCTGQEDNFYIDINIKTNSNLIEKLNELLVQEKIDQIYQINSNNSSQSNQFISNVWSRFSQFLDNHKFPYLIFTFFIVLILILVSVLLILNYIKTRKAKKLIKMEFKKKRNFSFDVIDLMGYRNSFKIFKWSNPDESNSISEEYQFENFSNHNCKPDQNSDAISENLIYELPYKYEEKSLNAGDNEFKFKTFSTRQVQSFKNESKRTEINFEKVKPTIIKLTDNSYMENHYSPVLSNDSSSEYSEPIVNVLSTFQSPKNLITNEKSKKFQNKINNV